jgi:hypothetical protein
MLLGFVLLKFGLQNWGSVQGDFFLFSTMSTPFLGHIVPSTQLVVDGSSFPEGKTI